jgi:hypothetical protein
VGKLKDQEREMIRTRTFENPDIDNPFDLVAYLLFKVRHSLERPEGGRPPRWIRIARAREAHGSGDAIGQSIQLVVDRFAGALAWMNELVLDIGELLVQTDAVAALIDTTADFIDAATSTAFQDALQGLFGISLNDDAMVVADQAVDEIRTYSGHIPGADDIVGLGHELFRLLCVVQKPLPEQAGVPGASDSVGSTTDEHVLFDVNSGTGKLRLLQWAFGSTLLVRGLGSLEDPEGHDPVAVARLGTRRLFHPGDLPTTGRGIWRGGDHEVEVFGVSFTGDAAYTDIVEAHELLDALGYPYYNTGGDPKPPGQATLLEQQQVGLLGPRLLRFQRINGLPMTGMLDTDSINRLMNMDFARRNLTRARPYDAAAVGELHSAILQPGGSFELVNGDGDRRASHEHIETGPDDNAYLYYKVGAPVPLLGGSSSPPPGWLIETRSPVRVPSGATPT